MKFRVAISVLTWAYFGMVLLLAALFQLLPNDAWFPTVLLYAPRWVWTVPGLLLLPVGVFKLRKLLLPVGLSLLFVVWLVMGFCLPWRTLGVGSASAPQFRILTCNCGGKAFVLSRLVDLIDDLQPDVVALQESSLQEAESLRAAGNWHYHREPDLVLLSRFPIERAQAHLSEYSTWRSTRAAVYRLNTGRHRISFINVHLGTPREGLEALLHRDPGAIAAIRANTEQRRTEAQAVASLVDASPRPTLLVGDLNLPVESSLYKDAFGDYQNAFSRAGWGFGHTKFTGWHGVRIDHVLGSADWEIVRCWVGADVGSDHRPLIADVSLAPQ